MNIRDGLIKYLDHLQRKNADDLAFYPLTTLQAALDTGHVLIAEENDEPAGYLWFGAIRPGRDVTVYQACIDYEARRHALGHKLVADLIAMAAAGGANGIRLKCASSAESNAFWQAIGFYCTRVSAGGVKRARDINHYRTDIRPTLFTDPLVVPSERPIDLAAYQRMKRDGVPMAYRFSRSHYP